MPQDVFFVVETVSAYVRFRPVPSSADPVDTVDINVRFREQGTTEINGILEIPTTASTLPYDPVHGLATVTMNSGNENVRVVLSPGSLISWGFSVAGDSDSRRSAQRIGGSWCPTNR